MASACGAEHCCRRPSSPLNNLADPNRLTEHRHCRERLRQAAVQGWFVNIQTEGEAGFGALPPEPPVRTRAHLHQRAVASCPMQVISLQAAL
jgi:hypothetical protein